MPIGILDEQMKHRIPGGLGTARLCIVGGGGGGNLLTSPTTTNFEQVNTMNGFGCLPFNICFRRFKTLFYYQRNETL
jgi:hypothetical protein